jgi:hypothetical protein
VLLIGVEIELVLGTVDLGANIELAVVVVAVELKVERI